jgi:hypothetical protein
LHKTESMNEELKQAVESYAKSVSRTTEAILPNRLRESIDAYNDGVHNGVLMGAQFLFSLLSNPSERPNIKDFLGDSAGLNDVHEQIIAAPRIYAYMQALDAYIDGLFAVPVKSAKPSENAKLLQPFSCCQENDSELLGAAERILHLHLCEQEGIGAGQPSPTDWLNAVDALSDAINNVKKQSK